MNLGLPLARLLGAMILAIIAWAAPSAAGAHEGGHHGHYRAPIASAHEPSAPIADISWGAAPTRIASPRTAIVPAGRIAVEAVASLGSGDGAQPDPAGPPGICCCGAACCAPGILAAVVTLPGPGLGRAVLRPGDTVARAGIEPASLAEPPRPLA